MRVFWWPMGVFWVAYGRALPSLYTYEKKACYKKARFYSILLLSLLFIIRILAPVAPLRAFTKGRVENELLLKLII
jgi:hypothetical protein